MPYMVTSSANYHWVERVEAVTNTNGVLKLSLHGNPDVSGEQFNMSEVTIFIDDQSLVDRLVAAINGCALTPAGQKERA
jgi:hypothetical protein